MKKNATSVLENRISKVIKALEKNNMQAFYAEDRCKALSLAKEFIKFGDTISFGGSVTLNECGVIDMLRQGDYKLLDRSAQNITPEQVEKIYRDTFSADVYFCSSNAITENGELYNVDGNANRISAISFGPKSVIIIAGYNKIVSNLDQAVERVKKIAAPANCLRLSKDTYCKRFGKCVSLKSGNAQMTDGCDSPDRICRSYLVSGKQKDKNRIKVILVGEQLGY